MSSSIKTRLPLFFLVLVISAAGLAEDNAVTKQGEMGLFIDNMVQKYKFSKDILRKLFEQVEIKPRIIEAITRPAEAKPWYQYRPIFVTQKRIDGGVNFMQQHSRALAQAEMKYGVPAEIITAIIGVETFYGRHKGGYRVMDALSTLAFDYPPRGKFFRSELEQFLLLTREEKIDPLTIKGSYAGAMGKPQFISSSYRRYAVDFDNDGKRDLWNNTTDAIGSVANYLSLHGWKRGAKITAKAEIGKFQHESLIKKGIKPHTSIQMMNNNGIVVPDNIPKDQTGSLISLENENGNEYWVGLNNFYVITRYNHSALYAMAVYQLSEEIKTEKNRRSLDS
ncbi:MAG: lytic murein transglycosylase B [Gammaproteobacteria bacterium]